MPQEKSLFAKNEEEILQYWEDKKIFEKTLTKISTKGNFVFFEGPPTANGRPGIHHVLARAFKDIILRFRTMQGYHIERKAGWDTHGLPVELQVEKELEISGKPEIEKYGIEEFNKKCKENVWVYKDEWEKLTRRIGFWLDLDHPYITYQNEYIESLWWIFKQIYNKNLVYKGYKVVPQCPRCGTALSSHEVAQGYKTVEENSIYIKFKLKGQENTYILSWTTTPWTLPSNVALAVGEHITYVKVKSGDEYYILAKDLINKVLEEKTEIVKEFKGEEMEDWEYEPLFPGCLDAGEKKAWFIGLGNFVSIQEGTGVVHTAVMYGEDDFEFGLENNLPFIHTVDEAGRFLPSVKKWAGRFVKDKKVEEEIIQDLQERSLLVKELKYEHDYPFCWRCDSPLLYYAKDSWFIKVTVVKKDLIKNNERINWIPDYIKQGRFGEWLDNIKDWAISRQRYWGTPMPIWVCDKCGQQEVIGSFKELEEKAKILPKNKDGELDVHRPFIDSLNYSCSCGGIMKRIPDVFDCWYDSGAMPFAQHHYPFENKDLIDCGKEHFFHLFNRENKVDACQFPAEYISEAIDQTRGWFYTLLVISTLLEKGVPYKNVICLGHIRDKEGKKMSKSKGNTVDPWFIANQYGVDALRMHLFSINQPGDPKNFDEKDVEEILRKVIMLFGNVVNFYEMYKREKNDKLETKNILDKWILAKLNLLIREVTKDLETYHVFEASRKLIDFINELSTWYVRRSRERLKIESEDKNQCAATLNFVIDNLNKLLAPFIPFTAERIYQKISQQAESVHLENWPKVDEKLIEWDVIKKMDVAKKIVELGLSIRAEKGIKVRQPLAELRIKDYELGEELTKIVADELNIKNIKIAKEIEETEGWLTRTDGVFTVSLNVIIDETLRQEGLLRELIRTLNQLRKEKGLTIKDRIAIIYETESRDLKNIFIHFKEQLMSQVLASSLKEGSVGVNAEELEIERGKIKIELN